MAVPSKAAAGSKVTTPVGSTVHTPSGVVSVVSIPGVDGSRSIVVISSSLLASLTLSASATVTLVSAAVVALSAVATGAAPATVTDTLAGADTLPSSSDTTYGIAAVPSKAGSGSKVTAPVASTVQTPSAVVKVVSIPGVDGSRSIVAMSTSLFASLTLLASATVTLVSAAVVVAFGVATGGAPATVTETLAGADTLPSSSATT